VPSLLKNIISSSPLRKKYAFSLYTDAGLIPVRRIQQFKKNIFIE